MMEVKITLRDEVEVDLFAQLTAVLRQKRAAEQNFSSEPLPTRDEIQAAIEKQYGKPGAEEREQPPTSGPVAPLTEEKSAVVGNIAPQAATPSESEAADALRAYIASKGVEAAVKLLGEFGVKRAGELAPEQRAAFIGKTTEASK